MRSLGRPGVLLLQLGTPDAPTPAALRRYLAEFLWDRRVIDLPRPLWWMILHGRVLRTRPRQSARLYQKVWTDGGSPLAVTSAQQASLLAQALGTKIGDVPVVVAMRYGKPSLRSAIDELQNRGVDRVLALPMYPQYAGATTGSSLQQLYEELGGRRVVMPVRVVPPYFAEPGYIRALAEVARQSLGSTACDRYLFSFHGLPARYVAEGDPYVEHCHATAGLLTAALELPPDRVTVTFQSRFGREPWVHPYTDETLLESAGRRERIAIMCPGFVADCLETIEEIGMTGRDAYLGRGGPSFHRIPCLNDHPSWIAALAALAERELAGWIGWTDRCARHNGQECEARTPALARPTSIGLKSGL